jgi:hypothetical protein
MGRAAGCTLFVLCCALPCAAAEWSLHNDGTATDPNGDVRPGVSLKSLIEDPGLLGPGDTVLIDSGTYLPTQIWWPAGKGGTWDRPLVIRGQGSPSDPNTLPLFCYVGGGTDDYWMRFRNNAHIQIANIRVDRVSRPIVFDSDELWDAAHDLTFENITLTWVGIPGENSGGRGFQFEEPDVPSTGAPQYNITIRNCTIRHVSEVGIKCHGRAHDILIENVTIEDVDNGRGDTTGDGITFTYDKWGAPSNITLRNVRVSGVSADGIDIKAFGTVRLNNCVSHACGADGIKLWSPNVCGWICPGNFILRDVRAYGAGQVGCELFYMPNADIERCSFSGAEQGLLYKWWANSDDADPGVAGWNSSTLRLYRNVFATTSAGDAACEIVKQHTIGPTTMSVCLWANQLENDAFWRWQPPAGDTTLDPNLCPPAAWDPAGIAIKVHAYGQEDANGACSLRDAANGAILGRLGIERSGRVGNTIPPYSPPADFNGDGVVDGMDFLIWQTGFCRKLKDASKRAGDATGEGVVDGMDFLVWQAWYPYRPGDFNANGSADAVDYFIWLGNYRAGTGSTRFQGDADNNGIVDYADFLVWQSQQRPGYSPPPDFNGDGLVDNQDLLIWQANCTRWPAGGAAKAAGDANGDGYVNTQDLQVWQQWNPYPPIRRNEP